MPQKRKKKEMIGSEKRIYTDSKWSMLVPDLIRLVLERMDFAAFHKARSISLDWYSTAELCIRQNPTPWIILFSSNDNFCKLFDPHQNKTYLVKDLGFDFHESKCLANSGSWFLMVDHRTNFYLLNMFTRERIRLPTLESIDGCLMRFDRIGESDFVATLRDEASQLLSISTRRKVSIRNAILWVDERSRDYFVVWNYDCFFAYHKRGESNKTWKVFRHQGCCVDMVFRDSKLYLLGTSKIIVFDFSVGDSPKECTSFPIPDCYHPEYFDNLAVTLSGEVFIISSIGNSFYNFYKKDPKSSGWSIIKSLGDEALLLDQGITVVAKDGVMKNCIYYGNDPLHRRIEINLRNNDNGICVYNIQTKNVVQVFPQLTDSSPLLFKDARWFFPNFGGKWLL